jgi:hypothetical protein
MPRARFVHPEIATDPDFAEFPLTARLFFVYVLNQADDAGNFPDDPRALKVQTFPYDDEISITDIVEFLHLFSERTRYVPYMLGERTWYHVRNFHKYQRPEHATAPKHPLYPEQIYRFSYRTGGKWVWRTVTEEEWNMEVYQERTKYVPLKVGKVGSVKHYQTKPTTTTTAPTDPGALPPAAGAPGPSATPPRKPTRINFEIPRHFDAMQEASRLGLNLNALDTLEKLEEEIATVKSGRQSDHQWVKKEAIAEKTT